MGPAPTGQGTADLDAAYRERGLTSVRVHDFNGAFDLVDVDTPGAPFAATDRVDRRIRGGGFELFLRLGNSYKTSSTPLPQRETVAQMLAMLDHVQAADPAHPVREVEIWNEPDNRQFWQDTPEAWFDLYVAAATAIRAKYPDVRIGGPALTPAGCRTPAGRRFLADFLATVRARSAPLDFITWHLYANDPAAFVEAAATYRAALRDAGLPDLDQVVTEWNTAYRPTPKAGDKRPVRDEGAGRDRDDPEVRTGARASAWTTGAWIAMQQAGVKQAYFYRGPDPKLEPSPFYGMFAGDGTPKPAGVAALLWKRLLDHPTRRRLDGGASGPLWGLAGESGEGEVAALLANSTGAPLAWTLSPAPAGPVALTRLRAPARALEESTVASLAGTLDPWEVALVRFRLAETGR
jgi:hypothetical protein